MKFPILTLFILSSHSLFAQDYTIAQLENSPRHHEWIQINNDGKTIHCFVAYPEVSQPTGVVISIHENRGLNDWARSFADQLAEKGVIVIAPDLLSSFSDTYQKTSDFPSSDEARKGIYALDADQVTSDLNAVFLYATELEAGNGEVSVVGFCWGGSQSFRYATNNKNLKMAGVFYGTSPKDKTSLAEISCPVFGFYGGNDARVNATIQPTEEAMSKYNKSYQYEIYDGAGHAFMRRGDDPSGDELNIKARDKAWERLISLLKQ